MALNFPNSPTVGQVYTDTTSGFSYEWDGTVWKSYSPASASNIKILDDISGSFNGSTQIFNITSGGVSLTPANAQSLIITLGGVTQEPGVDYTVNTSNITFTTAPEAALSFSGISLGPAVPITYANDGVIYIRNTYTGAGSTGPFSFPEGYSVGYLDVYRNGVRLSSGTDFVGTSGTNFFLTDAAAVSDEIEAIGYTITSIINASTSFDNINVTGITTTGRLQVTTNANIDGITTTGRLQVTTNANIVGIVTASGGFFGNVVGSALSISGISTFTNGPVLVGAATSTGTASQRLQVTGGAYISGNTGIGTTIPRYNLEVGPVGSSTTDLYVNGDITARFLTNTSLNNYSEKINDLGNVSGNTSINLSNGMYVTATLTGITTFSFVTGITTGAVGFSLQLTNGPGGPFTITWPVSVKWPNNSVPTRTTADSKTDFWVFTTPNNGTTWYGNLALYNFS